MLKLINKEQFAKITEKRIEYNTMNKILLKTQQHVPLLKLPITKLLSKLNKKLIPE